MKNTKRSPSSSASRAWLSGASSSDSSSLAPRYGLPSDSAMLGQTSDEYRRDENGDAKPWFNEDANADVDSSEHSTSSPSDSASTPSGSSSSGDSSSSTTKVAPYNTRPIPPTRPRSNASFRLKK